MISENKKRIEKRKKKILLKQQARKNMPIVDKSDFIISKSNKKFIAKTKLKTEIKNNKFLSDPKNSILLLSFQDRDKIKIQNSFLDCKNSYKNETIKDTDTFKTSYIKTVLKSGKANNTGFKIGFPVFLNDADIRACHDFKAHAMHRKLNPKEYTDSFKKLADIFKMCIESGMNKKEIKEILKEDFLLKFPYMESQLKQALKIDMGTHGNVENTCHAVSSFIGKTVKTRIEDNYKKIKKL